MEISFSRLLFASLALCTTLCSAQLETITFLNIEDYQVTLPTPPPTPSGSDIEILTDNGVDVFLGPDLSKRVLDAFKAGCTKDETPEECMNGINEALGVGPEHSEGLQKRIILETLKSIFAKAPAGIAGLAGAYASTMAKYWQWLLELDDPNRYSILTMHIPPAQTSALDKLTDADTFVVTASGNPEYTVSIAPAPTPEPENTPSTEEKDGGVILYVPGLETALKDAQKGLICKKEEESACPLPYAQTMILNMQASGDLAKFTHMEKWEFPEPKNKVLVDTLEQANKFAEKVYLGTDAGVKLAVNASAWVAWGVYTQEITLGSTIVFTKTIMSKATTEEEEKECEDGPDEEHTPFCNNCGGNREGTQVDGPGDKMGICKGLGGKYFQGCPCYIKESEEGPTGIDIDQAFQDILALPDFDSMPEPEPEPEPEQPEEPITDGSGNGVCKTSVEEGATKGMTGRDNKAINFQELMRCFRTLDSGEWMNYGEENDGMGTVKRCAETIDIISGSEGWENPWDCYDACKNCLSENMFVSYNQMWCDAWAGSAHCWMGYRIPNPPGIIDGTNIWHMAYAKKPEKPYDWINPWAAHKCLRELPYGDWIPEGKRSYLCDDAFLEFTLESTHNWESSSDCYDATKNCISQAIYEGNIEAVCVAFAKPGSSTTCKMTYSSIY